MAFLAGICGCFEAMSGPPNRIEIGCSKKMISKVIFRVEYLILVMKLEIFEKRMFLGYKRGRFGALMGPLMVSNDRYASP